MIQAISEGSAFQIAQKYLTENRVRIGEANDAQITSTLIGNSGLYEQTIRLKDGHLLSKCSCTLPEEPMCRHCIAVLLEYHRRDQPQQPQKPHVAKESKTPPRTAPSLNGKMSVTQWSAADVKLSDAMQLMEWLQPATKAIQAHQQLPDPPTLTRNEVSIWIETIRGLAEHRHENDQASTRLTAEVRDRETHVRRLSEELQTSMDEIKAAQTTAQALQLDIDTYRETMAKVAELATEIVKYEEQMRVAAGELLQEGSPFEKLANSVKEIAQTLKAAVKPVP
ncbi:MAG: hypothetical protein HC801_13065 [Nitrospira sp.]|nr:hypothetical protein [Nitrospira sp.]